MNKIIDKIMMAIAELSQEQAERLFYVLLFIFIGIPLLVLIFSIYGRIAL